MRRGIAGRWAFWHAGPGERPDHRLQLTETIETGARSLSLSTDVYHLSAHESIVNARTTRCVEKKPCTIITLDRQTIVHFGKGPASYTAVSTISRKKVNDLHSTVSLLIGAGNFQRALEIIRLLDVQRGHARIYQYRQFWFSKMQCNKVQLYAAQCLYSLNDVLKFTSRRDERTCQNCRIRSRASGYT